MGQSMIFRDAQLDTKCPSTSVGIARQCGKWKELPFLRENDCLLPPCMIAVGDRRRVASAAKLLKEAVLLHEAVEKLVGPYGRGRVDVAVGIFEHAGKPLPVTILETGVGCPAQEIYGLEGLLLSRTDGYSFDGMGIKTGGINLIRAGMCRGIILSQDGKGDKKPPFIRSGDIVIATSSLGDGIVARQGLGFGSSLDPASMRRFWDVWCRKLKLGFTEDSRWPVLNSTPAIVTALSKSCGELGLERQMGANLTKDSRRLEQHAEELMLLREKHGVFSTEMDHFGLAFLAHELSMHDIPTSHGLISCVAGTVPGNGDPPSAAMIKQKEHGMMEAALLALWKVVHNDSEPGRSATGIAP